MATTTTKLLSTKRIGKMLGVVPQTVRFWMQTGRLTKDGKRVKLPVAGYERSGGHLAARIAEEDLQAFLEQFPMEPPEGYAYLEKAARKVGVLHTTLRAWMKRGVIIGNERIFLKSLDHNHGRIIKLSDAESIRDRLRKQRGR